MDGGMDIKSLEETHRDDYRTYQASPVVTRSEWFGITQP